MQRTDNPRALQWLRCAKFFAQRHKAGHFGFGNVYFFATEIGLINIGNDIIVESHRLGLREFLDDLPLAAAFNEIKYKDCFIWDCSPLFRDLRNAIYD